jgi:hypothetical protein
MAIRRGFMTLRSVILLKAVILLFALPAIGLAQTVSTQNTSLAVSGHAGQAAVIQRNGRSYVDVEALARLTGATLGFQGNRIVLTLPAPPPAVITPVVQPQPAVVQLKEERGYSRDFLRAGVEQMTVVREWRSAIENAVRTNNPVEESWVSYYRRTAQDKMTMTSASATTEADRKALPLLQNAMSMVTQLSDRFLALRSTLTYVSPDTLDNDPLDQKILGCAQGMAAQAIPGASFEDVSACH